MKIVPIDRYDFMLVAAVVTMAVSCAVFETKRYISQKTLIYHTPYHFTFTIS